MPADPTTPLTREWFEEGLRRNGVARIVLGAPCHRQRGARVRFWEDGVVEVRCDTCNSFVLSFSITNEDRAQLAPLIKCDDPSCGHGPSDHVTRVVATCHRQAGLLVTYEDGAVLAKCARCKVVAWTFHPRPHRAVEPTTTITPIAPTVITKPT